MTPEELLNRLVVQGFQLSAHGEKLELTGDLSRLTDELRSEIRSTKYGLLRLVERRDERIAIQGEAFASPEGLEWPTCEDVKNRKLPPGWTITEWLPAPLAQPQETSHNEQDASRRSPRSVSNSQPLTKKG